MMGLCRSWSSSLRCHPPSPLPHPRHPSCHPLHHHPCLPGPHRHRTPPGYPLRHLGVPPPLPSQTARPLRPLHHGALPSPPRLRPFGLPSRRHCHQGPPTCQRVQGPMAHPLPHPRQRHTRPRPTLLRLTPRLPPQHWSSSSCRFWSRPLGIPSDTHRLTPRLPSLHWGNVASGNVAAPAPRCHHHDLRGRFAALAPRSHHL